MKTVPENNPPGISPSAETKAMHQHLFQRGLKWLGGGVFLMALSFGINFFSIETGSGDGFIAFMYLLTTAGAAVILKGLVDMLGF
ncbi:MAG: hypothetical protein IPL65_03115 [Lewinellaceae bacterium]|nr:hypothetical protein [Lewinellaceae bacterium]